LVKAEAISEKQLQAAVAVQRRRGGLLGEVLIEMNLLSEETLVMALSRQLGVPRADPKLLDNPEPAAVRKLTQRTAVSFRAVPLALQDGGKLLVVGIAEPQNLVQVDELEKVTGCKVSPRLVGPATLSRLIEQSYGASEESTQVGRDTGGPGGPAAPQRTKAGLRTSSRRLSQIIAPRSSTSSSVPAPADRDEDVHSLLQRLEEGQQSEVAAMRAMIELLIDRGVFSREEYLARIRR
jgi:hypothetical protein